MNCSFSHSDREYYQVGGSLTLDRKSYVVREADRQLYESAKAMQFCYVFNARQMGKSSLRVRAIKKLRKEGFDCISIEMREACSYQVGQEQFYGTILSYLVSDLDLEIDEGDWWDRYAHLPPVERLNKFIQDEMLVEANRKVVIFFDEIDSIIDLDFKDDFFAFIRACYNKRAKDFRYNRLTFVLLGVATPSNLIDDNSRTPFNIASQPIELSGFQLHEIQSLEQGFSKFSNPKAILEAVLNWSSGQPFLTQKLCQLIVSEVDRTLQGDEEKIVEQIARSRIIKNWLNRDNPEHLQTIRDRILRSQNSRKLLKLYQKILQRGEIQQTDRAEEMELQLSGLVVKRNNKLQIYNRIYREVFNKQWVQEHLDSLQFRVPARQTIAASVAIGVLVMGARLLGLLQPLELAAFDKQMQLRPAEPPDERLLLVTISDRDLQELGDKYPISDKMMLRLLQKLDEYQPSAIGIDIIRDRPEGEGQEALIQYIKQNDRIFPVCIHPKNSENDGVPPLVRIAENRIGFIDIATDFDQKVRRHLLALSIQKQCPAYYALSVKVSYRYLEAQGYFLTSPPGEYWEFSSGSFETLQAGKGFYQNPDEVGGYQIMLNYRSVRPLERIAKQITLTDVIRDRVKRDEIEGRIVLIGVTDPRLTLRKDIFNTSYDRETQGLSIHAHQVSQIISFVENGRNLLWFLPIWGDLVLVIVCSFVGGVMFWGKNHFLIRGMILVIGALGLTVISLTSLVTQGLLLPLIPSVLGLEIAGITALGIVVYTNQD